MALQTKQHLQQRFMLAPNITLALEVLRMPMQELQAFLEHQLQENPCLELEEADTQEPSQEAEPAETPKESASDGLDEDWTSQWNTVNEREADDGDDSERQKLDPRVTTFQSLQESLLLQLGCQTVTEEERRLGEALIQHLDDNGYLDGSLEELAGELGVEPARLEAALRLVQRLDPPGIGARNLKECLLLQLEQDGAPAGGNGLPAHRTLAIRILRDHFDLFAHYRLAQLAKATGASLEDITRACKLLKGLNPKPALAFSADLPPSIVPDLVIHHRERHYDVELNDQGMPRVGVSRAYYRMLKDPRTPSDAKEFLAGNFRKATWLIKAIDERNTTLLSIARCLISLQREFIEHGSKAMKPLTQAQVAQLVGRHPSTVSRAIAGKTIDTPYGVFRLEQLFASGVPQAGRPDGGEDHGAISDERIKAEIRRLVEEEDPRHTLSDAALAERLAQRNISVARRTITKYRTSLKILPAHLRRRF